MAKTGYVERLASIRQQIAETKAEAQRVQWARLPFEEAASRIAPLVDALAHRWTPSVNDLAATAPPTVESILQTATADPWTLAGMIAVVARDGLEAALRGALEATYEAVPPEDCLALAERPGRLEALAAKLHELEVADERTICEAARAGVKLDRRADASPAAIFAVLDEAPAA